MKMQELICRMKCYIQPFERELAIRELTALSGCTPLPVENPSASACNYLVRTEQSIDHLASRLTYWESIRDFESNPDQEVLTEQTLVEAASLSDRRRIVRSIDTSAVVLPNRRRLRYGSHGIHEYRGKFFPQLVRSLLNIAAINPGSLVLDPMCGSGTTLVEAISLGCNTLGFDVNPLSLLISRAKCGVLRLHPSNLQVEQEKIFRDLTNKANNSESRWLNHLGKAESEYLHRWFSEGTLSSLDQIMIRLTEVRNPAIRDLCYVSLSNILRAVSWQKDDDLRVRRDISSGDKRDPVELFEKELRRSVKEISAYLEHRGIHETGSAQIIEADARSITRYQPQLRGEVDVIVTSPPYATALPYLDTDRLSLCYLGLLERSSYRDRERLMIGNREIGNGLREKYWGEYKSKRTKLPKSITTLIDTVEQQNRESDVGFRRLNKAALLGRYFFDMSQVLQSFCELLRKGSNAYVVVGTNYTIAGGERVEIKTDRLLADLGESVGLKLDDQLSMDMLVSRDIFRKKSSKAETILVFKNV